MKGFIPLFLSGFVLTAVCFMFVATQRTLIDPPVSQTTGSRTF